MGKLRKSVLFIITLSLMLVMVTGCNSKTKEVSKEKSDVVTTDSSTKDTLTSDEVSKYFHSKDHVTLKIMLFGDSDSEECNEVATALSKITEEKLNCDVKITMVGFGTYMEQLNMMLFSGEEFDLFAPIGAAVDMVSSGQIQPIDELLEKFGSDMLNMTKEKDWAQTTFGGKKYGVCVNAEKGEQLGFGMRKDICDELSIDYKNMSTLDDIHNVLVKVKEAYPDMYPVVSDGGAMFSGAALIGQDSVGDTFNLTVSEDPFAEKVKIVNFFETDLFKERVSMLYNWAKEGLIMPDASTNTESAIELVAAGKGFGYFQHMKPGWEQEQSDSIGKEMVSIRYGKPIATTDGIAWYVPTSSVDPERAVALLNLMYTDSEVSNLVINGIEGKDYVVKDKEKGIAGYPEGVDGSNAKYSRMGWAWPNQQISYLWEGQELDIWDQYKEFNDNALETTGFGFMFDATNVLNEITACTNVYQKYVPALYAGSLNPDTAIPKLNAEMKKAGIYTIIKEKQKQVDEWLSKKNK